MPTKFTPSFEVIDSIDILPLASNIKNEIMLYQASIEFARKNGGPIMQQFLNRLPLTGSVIIDSRVHRLSRGYYPAIPGYHLDWIPRKNHGQDPDLSQIPEAEHVIFILGETSLTEFVSQEIDLSIPEMGAFEYCNLVLKMMQKFGELKTTHLLNGQMVKFTSRDWHRAVPAEGNEWRYFIRASKVERKPSNEIRTQSQVYIPVSN